MKSSAGNNAILEGLNPQQIKATTHQNGPLLIIAGAGTGKTTVITRHVAWLIANGLTNPDEILALTFTEKAAGEMEERVSALLPMGYFDLWISTFHSFGERILQDHALDIGLSNNFRLLTETEQWLLLNEHLEELELDYYRPKGHPTKFVQALVTHFSRLKDEEITPQEYADYAQQLRLDADGDEKVAEATRLTEIALCYQKYQKLLEENNAMDFGDLIANTLHLFKTRPAILQLYRQKFKYILVDEFQDTNFAQYDLIKLLAAPRNNLTVVGDDDQSVYAWRGASMSSILTFKKDFPTAQEVALTQNYRSAQNILDLAYKFIRHNNPNRLETTIHINKRLTNATTAPATIEHLHAATSAGEAKLVLDKILELKKATNSWNDFAILVRANDQAQIFIPFLERTGVPYQFLASRGLFAKPIILDISAWLQLLDNYHESRAMYRVLNFDHWHIPPEDIMRLANFAHQKTKSFYEACQEARTIKQLTANTYTTIDKIMSLLAKHALEARRHSVGEMVLLFLEESGYLRFVTSTRRDHYASAENILYLNQFYKYIEAFERANLEKTVSHFVREYKFMLASGENGRLQPDFTEGPESVKIMTIHAAKGLEFAYVFVVNLVDKKFPTVARRDSITIPEALIKDILPAGDLHLEEERRLFYVAVTRAKHGLFLTSAEDYGGLRKKKPSRFLLETGFSEFTPQPTGEVIFKSEQMGMANTGTAVSASPKSAAKTSKFLDKKNEYSFTQLKAYETCPYQYRFAFVLKVPVPGKPSFSFGRTMHRTLYEFFNRMVTAQQNHQTSLFAAKKTAAQESVVAVQPPVAPPSEEELLKIYEQNWIPEWYTSKKNRQEYYNKGREALKEFYVVQQRAGWPRARFLEEGFHIQFGEIRLRGVIDRVDMTGDTKTDTAADRRDRIPNEQYTIVDYKTGKFPKNGKKDAEQLFIYAAAIKEMLGVYPANLIYYFIEDNKELLVDFTPAQVEKVKEWANDLARKVQSGDFTATPGFQCKTCDYREICEFRKL